MSNALNAESVYVVELFDQVFKPLHLAGRESEHSLYRSSLTWLSKALGHDARLVELTKANLVATLQAAATAGIGKSRVKSIRTHLGHVWKFAHAIGLAPEPFVSVPLPKCDDVKLTPPQLGELAEFYREHVRPRIEVELTHKGVQRHDRAIEKFDRFRAECGNPIITLELVQAYTDWIAARGLAENTIRQYREAVLRVLHWSDTSGIPNSPTAGDAAVAAAPSNRGRFESRRHLPQNLPDAAPGTLRHYFEVTYLPQRLAMSSLKTLISYRSTLAGLYVFCGNRDIRLEEISDDLVAGYMASMVALGLNPNTANAARSNLLAIWRMAWRRRLIEHAPRVEKLRGHHEEPDSWDEDELRRIIAAVDRVDYSGLVAGFNFADYWRALLLTGYYTALRRSSLFKIRSADVDLAAGRIYVRADSMKTGRGKSFRVGPDCIAALRPIWSADRELLFPWPYGLTAMFQHFRRILRAAGIATGRRRSLQMFHKLRRSSATMIHRRAGMQAASDLLGHSSAQMTLKYIDPSQLDDRDATRHLNPLVDLAATPPPSSTDPTPPATGEIGGAA